MISAARSHEDARRDQRSPHGPAVLRRARRAPGQDRRPRRGRHAYDIAIGLERDPAVRRFLQRRQSALPA